jgi:pimeloyl-ACP methyl ester carboxylesterase
MQKETVVLLHGIGRTKRSMKALEKALSQDGYNVINIDYPSRKQSTNTCAKSIVDEIKKFCGPEDKIHFVAHSMGAIIVRQLLAAEPIANIGNIVLLGPPNHGSEIADFLHQWVLYKQFYGPAGQELTTIYAQKTPFPAISQSFGVIAGNLCLNPFSVWILPTKSDGIVTIESTKLSGMLDHIVLSCTHSFMMMNKKVIDQVLFFLKNSKFKHDTMKEDKK